MHDNVFKTPPYITCVDFLGIIQKKGAPDYIQFYD